MYNYLTLSKFYEDDVNEMVLLAYARKYRLNYGEYKFSPTRLAGKTLTLLFQKTSPRAKLYCSVAWQKLGGNVTEIYTTDTECVFTTTKEVSLITDCIVAFGHQHEKLLQMEEAVEKDVPLINGSSDMFHPLQILGDLLTMYEFVAGKNRSDFPSLKKVLSGKKVCWIGNSNNKLNSFVQTLPRLGIMFSVATPEKYPIEEKILAKVKREDRFRLTFTHDPLHALKDADFIISDTWTDESNNETFQISKKFIRTGKAHKNWQFLHHLPRCESEVSDVLFYSNRSLVFNEAENRMWTTMSIFELLM